MEDMIIKQVILIILLLSLISCNNKIHVDKEVNDDKSSIAIEDNVSLKVDSLIERTAKNIDLLQLLKIELTKIRIELLELIENEKYSPRLNNLGIEDDLDKTVRIDRVNMKLDDLKYLWYQPHKHIIENLAAREIIKKEIEYELPELSNFKKSEIIIFILSRELFQIKLSNNLHDYSQTEEEDCIIKYNNIVTKWNDNYDITLPKDKSILNTINEYRIMLGRMALKINKYLVEWAREESNYSSRTSKIKDLLVGYSRSHLRSGVSINNATDERQVLQILINNAENHRLLVSRNWIVFGAGFDKCNWNIVFSTYSRENNVDFPNVPEWKGIDWR